MFRKTLRKFSLTDRRLPKWAIGLGLAILAAIALKAVDRDIQNLFQPLERSLSIAEEGYRRWGRGVTNPWLLMPFALGGGLLASISPCILALLPVNLSYIGTLDVKSRWQALRNATGFVLGVVTVLSGFGLFSAFCSSMLSSESDRQVVTALCQGNADALGAIYDRYGAAVYRLALKMIGNPTEAEDLTQEVFLAFWRGVAKYDPDRGTLLPFLLTITRSRALNRLKQQASTHNLQERFGQHLPRDNPPPGMAAATLNELQERMSAALDRLPTTHKQVLEMGYYQGKSQSEIAQELNLPLGTVKTRSRQGLLKLRQLLQDLVE